MLQGSTAIFYTQQMTLILTWICS